MVVDGVLGFAERGVRGLGSGVWHTAGYALCGVVAAVGINGVLDGIDMISNHSDWLHFDKGSWIPNTPSWEEMGKFWTMNSYMDFSETPHGLEEIAATTGKLLAPGIVAAYTVPYLWSSKRGGGGGGHDAHGHDDHAHGH